MRSLLFAVLSILCTACATGRHVIDAPVQAGMSRGEALGRLGIEHEKSCKNISQKDKSPRRECLAEAQRNGKIETWELTYTAHDDRSEYAQELLDVRRTLVTPIPEQPVVYEYQANGSYPPPPPPQFFQPDPNAFINAANALTSRPQVLPGQNIKIPGGQCFGPKPFRANSKCFVSCIDGSWAQVCN